MEKNYKPYTKDKLKKSLTILKNVLGLAPEEVKTHNLKNIDECKNAMKIIADKYAYKKYLPQINELEQEIKLQREKANSHLKELKEAYEKIKKLETEIANTDNCKALYKEIDELREEIEFKNKEIEQLKIKYEEMCESRYKFIITAKSNEIELEIQKMHKKAFAGALVVSVIINILLVWGNL